MDQGQVARYRAYALLLLGGELPGPLAYARERAALGRLPPLLHAPAQVVFADEALVVLVELALERLELLGRDRHEHHRGVVDRAPGDGAIALLDAAHQPHEIALVQAVLDARPGFGEKDRVFGQLLVAVPGVQPVEARAEFLL